VTADLLAAVEAAAGLAVYGVPATAARRELVAAGVPARLAGLDRLTAFRRSRELLPQLAELREELGDLTDVVVTGPAHAASAITRTLGKSLLTAPLSLDRTIVVVTDDDAPPAALWQACLDAGYTEAEAARHFVLVGGSEPVPGLVIVPADPHAPGPWSALTAPALVPAALAGVDVAELLDEADSLAASLASDTDNPALALGVALGAADGPVALISDGTGFEGFGDWVAELLQGIVPAVVEGPGAVTITYGGALPPAAVPGGGTRSHVAVNGPLGAQFLAWQYAAVVAAQMRGTNPSPIS
jgi:hypothetical protein